MRQERVSLIRAFWRAFPATSMLLVACGLPSLASATDIGCRKSSTLPVPADRLKVEAVDLIQDSQASPGDSGPTQDADIGSHPVAPDLSSRARSLAILREIFGEPVTDEDFLDFGITVPPIVAGDDLTNPGPLRRPAAGAPDNLTPGSDISADDDRSGSDTDARLPGSSEQETVRYRRQMYRTDI